MSFEFATGRPPRMAEVQIMQELLSAVAVKAGLKNRYPTRGPERSGGKRVWGALFLAYFLWSEQQEVGRHQAKQMIKVMFEDKI